MHPPLQKYQSSGGACDCPDLQEGLDSGQQSGSPDNTNGNNRLLFLASHRPTFSQELAFKIRQVLLFAQEKIAHMFLERLLKASRASANSEPYGCPLGHMPLLQCISRAYENRKLSHVMWTQPSCFSEKPGPMEALGPSAHRCTHPHSTHFSSLCHTQALA